MTSIKFLLTIFTLETHIKITKINKLSNFLVSSCMENTIENIHTDIAV